MVTIKTERQIGLMRQAGRHVAEILSRLQEVVKPGIETGYLEEVAVLEIEKRRVKPSFKGYQGYPAVLCVSVNDTVVHGIPGRRRIEEGDLVSIDLGVIYRGYQADGAITVGVGKLDGKARELIEATRSSLMAGIEKALAGANLGNVSSTVQRYVEERGFAVIREYAGHGIGRSMHEEPQVPNYGCYGEGIVLEKGMVLAIEPMVVTGDWRTRVMPDGWAVTTVDGGMAAHFEHTVAITESKPEILTLA